MRAWQCFFMEYKELVVRMDPAAIAVLEEEIKKKRNLGVANSVGDRFLIRLLGAISDNTKAFLFKIEKNKIVIRNYATLNYDDNRQARGTDREDSGTSP